MTLIKFKLIARAISMTFMQYCIYQFWILNLVTELLSERPPFQQIITHTKYKLNSAHTFIKVYNYRSAQLYIVNYAFTARSPFTNCHRRTLPIFRVFPKILSAGALRLYHTIYWDLCQDLHLPALIYIHQLPIWEMPHLAFFLVPTNSSIVWTKDIKIQKLTNKSYTPKLLRLFVHMRWYTNYHMYMYIYVYTS